VEGLNEVEIEGATQEFDLLSANLDTPVEAGVEVPYPPSTLNETDRKVYDLSLLQVAYARARGSLNRD
jgi:BarA-like signal transduction histidine kinase